MRLARRVQDLAESATLAVTAAAAQMRADGIDVISLGAGEPDFDTPANIQEAAAAALAAGKTKYSKPAAGTLEARKAVCEKLLRDNELAYTPEQVIITAGGKMAIYLAMCAVLDPGDEVIIPAPYWVSYPEIAKLMGAVPLTVTGSVGNDYKLTPQDLYPVLSARTKLFLLNSPSNPSGVTYSPDELRAIAGVLQERDLLVLSDEIYERLVFDGQESVSYAALDERAYRQTLTVNSASKTYAMTGWRVGYAAGPVEVIRAMHKLQSQSTSGAVTFNQDALIEALTGDQSRVNEMRLAFQQQVGYMYKRLVDMPGVRCPRPTGAFYCFPDVAGAYSRLRVAGSLEFADALLREARVAVVPGKAFGLDNHVRVSSATSMENIVEGLNRIEAFLG
ncbi:MAG: pyridoxal phosphate-dependent aminotransferase [Phycisphaerae bacterium]